MRKTILRWRTVARVFLDRRRRSLSQFELAGAIARLGLIGRRFRHGYVTPHGRWTSFHKGWRLFWIVKVPVRVRLKRRVEVLAKKKRKRRYRKPAGWVRAHNEEARQVREKAKEYPVDEIDGHFLNSDHSKDWYHQGTRFIWTRPALPLGKARFFMARFWFWALNVEDKNNPRWMLWVQTLSGAEMFEFPYLEDVRPIIEGVFRQFIKTFKVAYVKIHELAAWTAWSVDRARRGIPYHTSKFAQERRVRRRWPRLGLTD